MIWTLILFAHIGIIGSGNSNALTSVGDFKTQQACIVAGKTASSMISGSVKKIDFVCVKNQ